jgi:hypothetical protein
MTTEAVSSAAAAGTGVPAAPRSAAAGSTVSQVTRVPSLRGSAPLRPEPAPEPVTPAEPGSGAEPVAVDAALVDVMVRGARMVAAVEAATLAAVAALVLGRQAAARDSLLAWRREHPDSRPARQDWDSAAAECEESVAGEVADEVAAALRLSGRAARARLDLAVDLMTITPATLEALRTGALDVARARRIVEAVAPVHATDPALAAVVEAEILARAGEQTPAQLAASARRAVLRRARELAEQASDRAQRERRVGVAPAHDPAGRDAGQADLWVTGRADRVEAAFANLTRVARAHLQDHPDETRTVDQVRADLALTALIGDLRIGRLRISAPAAGDPEAGDPTRVSDPPVTVHLVMPLSTLTGGGEPAELVGHGPVPAPLARDLLLRTEPAGDLGDPATASDVSPRRHERPVTVLLREDVTYTRWLTDPAGIVTTTGTRTYRPSAGIARTVRARDLTCRFPGCRVGGQRCDLDHAVSWPAGETSPANLAAVCRHHHEEKTKGRWGVTLDPTTAALTWTAPTGHTYTTHPPAWPEGP